MQALEIYSQAMSYLKILFGWIGNILGMISPVLANNLFIVGLVTWIVILIIFWFASKFIFWLIAIVGGAYLVYLLLGMV